MHMHKKETSKPLVIVLCIIIIFSFTFAVRRLGRMAHAAYCAI